MQNSVSVVFAIVFGIAFFATVSYCVVKQHISRKYFNLACLEHYEQDVEVYNFALSDTIEESAKKIGKRIVYSKIKTEATIDTRNASQIVVNKSLRTPERNFAVAHELGHVLRGLRGNRSVVARDKKNFFSRLSPEEQICDYYAAAILLPRNDMKQWMDHVDFLKLNEESKVDRIIELARDKNISEDVVYRRINEVCVLENS